jgi:hypothetical protein
MSKIITVQAIYIACIEYKIRRLRLYPCTLSKKSVTDFWLLWSVQFYTFQRQLFLFSRHQNVNYALGQTVEVWSTKCNGLTGTIGFTRPELAGQVAVRNPQINPSV